MTQSHPDLHSRIRKGGGKLVVFGADGHIRPMREIEAEVIRLAVVHYRANASEVARALGLGRSTLYRELREFSIIADVDVPDSTFEAE